MCTQALWLGLVMCTKAGSQNTKNMALPSSPPLSPINNRQSPTTINQQSKVAVARLVVRTGNAPSLVALWPQAEERDEHGWQVGGGVAAAAGTVHGAGRSVALRGAAGSVRRARRAEWIAERNQPWPNHHKPPNQQTHSPRPKRPQHRHPPPPPSPQQQGHAARPPRAAAAVARRAALSREGPGARRRQGRRRAPVRDAGAGRRGRCTRARAAPRRARGLRRRRQPVAGAPLRDGRGEVKGLWGVWGAVV